MDMNYRGGMWEGGGWARWSGVGGKWDNCNSIINKYIKKKKNHVTEKTKQTFSPAQHKKNYRSTTKYQVTWLKNGQKT